eukprot:gene6717-352_t
MAENSTAEVQTLQSREPRTGPEIDTLPLPPGWTASVTSGGDRYYLE